MKETQTNPTQDGTVEAEVQQANVEAATPVDAALPAASNDECNSAGGDDACSNCNEVCHDSSDCDTPKEPLPTS